LSKRSDKPPEPREDFPAAPARITALVRHDGSAGDTVMLAMDKSSTALAGTEDGIECEKDAQR
jgi:uncharacterized protein GlcG (DUF336 family)